MRLLLFLLLTIGSSYSIDAQDLKGILLDARTGNTISDARVWVLGGDSYPATSNDGEYSLNLSVGEVYKAGEEIELYISHEKYGFHRKRKIIPHHMKVDIEIERSNIIAILGSIKDQHTGDPLQNISVTVVSKKFAHPDQIIVPETLTDKYGRFQLILSKEVAGDDLEFVRLAMRDDNGQCYKAKEEVMDISSYLHIELEKTRCNESLLEVETYFPRAIHIELGDQIIIEPGGAMKIGIFLGTSTPKGRQGLGGFNIEAYSYFPTIPHAALLCRFSWEPKDKWRYCGERIEFTAQQDGYIEFNINDNKQQDNSGHYDVKVTIQK